MRQVTVFSRFRYALRALLASGRVFSSETDRIFSSYKSICAIFFVRRKIFLKILLLTKKANGGEGGKKGANSVFCGRTSGPDGFRRTGTPPLHGNPLRPSFAKAMFAKAMFAKIMFAKAMFAKAMFAKAMFIKVMFVKVMQKNGTNPLTRGERCDKLRLPLRRGLFFVRFFAGSSGLCRAGLFAKREVFGSRASVMRDASNLNRRCRN